MTKESVAQDAADNPRTVERLRQQLAKEKRGTILSNIADAKMPPALKEHLSQRVHSIKFDENTDIELPTLTMSEVISIFNRYGKHDK